MTSSSSPPSGRLQKLFTLATATLASTSTATASSSNTTTSGLYELSTNELNRTSWQRQPYVSNGYISQRIPAEGFGYRAVVPTLIDGDTSEGTNGWPLFDPRFTAAMVAGFYDSQPNTTGTNFPQTGGEQPISTLPTWSSLYFSINNQTYDTSTPDSQISNWTQSQSIQDGVVETQLEWTPEGMNESVSIKYTLFAHRTWPNLGVVKLDVDNAPKGSVVSVTDVLDGIGAWRTDFVGSNASNDSNNTIWTSVRPNGISNVTAYEISILDFLDKGISTSLDVGSSCYSRLTTNASTISQCYRFSIPDTGSFSTVKYVGIASSDAFNGTENETAMNVAREANSTGYESLLKSHRMAWDAIWEDSDIVIPGEQHQELQIATRASMFHLLSNVRPGNESTGLGDNSIAPSGLTSDSYSGQIFWDSDTWMMPSILALQPDYAESIVDFRYRQLGAAQENAKQFNLSGALYPWVAGRFGNCTGVGPCNDYEYHLNADIALAVYQYYSSTQNQTWLEEKGWPIVEAVSDMFASFVVYDNSTGLYSTYNETSPDEYSNHKNNSAMTNGAIAVTLKNAQTLAGILGKETPSNWTDIASNITILVDPSSKILLEFDGFNGTTAVKQADVVLLTYPYEYNLTKTQGLANLDYYSLATSPNGPGMTSSIFSIDAAELSPVGCATWTYLLGAAQPYSRLPFYQFSEQTIDVYAENGGTNPAYTFLTGHGGFLQTWTHGFTGFRARVDRLYFNPLLPPQLDEYTIKGFKWGGNSFDIYLTKNETTIMRKSGGSQGDVKIEIASQNAKGGNYTLAAGEGLTVPTSATNGTLVDNNVAQCARVLSNDTSFQNPNEYIVPGEYALAAVDGANATVWQPKTSAPATLSIDLSESKSISGVHINWGSQPPLTMTILAGSSLSNMSTLFGPSVPINISSPYSPELANQVSIKVGNLTDLTLNERFEARYVNLTIEGARDGVTTGGTVAEFAVLST